MGRRDAARAARWRGPARLADFGRSRRRASAQLGDRRHRARAACCRGCRSPSGSASRSISPPTASRRCGRRSALAVVVLRHRVRRAAAADRVPDCAGVRGRRRGLCRRDAEDRAGRASGPGAARRQRRRSRASSRCARSASAPTASWCARAQLEGAAHRAEARARARLGAKGTAPPVGAFVDVQGAAEAAARSRCGPAATTSPATCISSGIGASGFVLGAIKTAEPPAPPGLWLRYAADDRRACATRSTRASARSLPGDKGAIASALITGKRDAISAPVNDAMYVSSLAHVLSISGYHMAVVAGVVFFVLRALLALMPAFASRQPIKKWAALGGAGRGGVLSAAVGRRGRDPARLHHDRDRADRRDGRPAGADAAHARGRGASPCCCSRRKRWCIRASRCRLRRRSRWSRPTSAACRG